MAPIINESAAYTYTPIWHIWNYDKDQLFHLRVMKDILLPKWRSSSKVTFSETLHNVHLHHIFNLEASDKIYGAFSKAGCELRSNCCFPSVNLIKQTLTTTTTSTSVYSMLESRIGVGKIHIKQHWEKTLGTWVS